MFFLLSFHLQCHHFRWVVISSVKSSQCIMYKEYIVSSIYGEKDTRHHWLLRVNNHPYICNSRNKPHHYVELRNNSVFGLHINVAVK